MSLHSLFLVSLLALVNAQTPTTTSLTPLASKNIPYDQLPYQVSGDNAGPRGPQYGYNQCNATTENQDSSCQTLIVNNLADFCIWSSPKLNDTIGNSEAYEVAWCTQPGHGSRVMPPGTVTGAQWLYAKNYVQIVGYLNQSAVNLNSLDEGGELDPHGDDEQGNPLGGEVYTNAFAQNTASWVQQFKSGKNNATNETTQIHEWVSFIGGGMFCQKFCTPSDPNAPALCQHIYDEIGCTYNAIADYPEINGTFQVCDSDDMAPPGIFTDAEGELTTWVQPFTGTFSAPYTTKSLASSNCVTFASTDLYAAAATLFPSSATTSASVAGSTGTGAASGGVLGGVSGGVSGSETGSGASPSATGSGAVSNGLATSGPVVAFLGVMFGAMITIFA